MLYEVNHGLSDKISSVMSHFCRNHCSFSPISINSYIVLKLLRRQKKTLPSNFHSQKVSLVLLLFCWFSGIPNSQIRLISGHLSGLSVVLLSYYPVPTAFKPLILLAFYDKDFRVGTILVSLKLPFITCYKLPNARISWVSDFIACHKFLQTLFKMV